MKLAPPIRRHLESNEMESDPDERVSGLWRISGKEIQNGQGSEFKASD